MKKKEPKKLTHVDARGHVHMVDVGTKADTRRVATARATVSCKKATLDLVREGTNAKGDVLATVRIAAISAAKRTAELIPLCHPLPLTRVHVDIQLKAHTVHIDVTCETTGKTGVEMEALTAASVGALTFYDMVKAVDRSATFEVSLQSKVGGKSGAFTRKS